MNSIKIGILALLLTLSTSLYTPWSQAADDSTQGFTEPELAQILAPIALYPDSLLSHILIASTYPIEVVQANRWRKQNASLSATDAVNKAEDQDWDPSVIALVGFPDVLETLSNDLDWTQKVGDAFLQDETQVLASIQTLRQQADEANSLSNMDKMKVTKVNNEIIIEPVETQVVYVPVYDPRVVYGRWHWHNYPPVFWDRPSYINIGYSHDSSSFFWSSGIYIGFNYYFSAFHWHDRHIIVTRHRHSNHYRPHNRIVASDGAHRWKHKPHHRRGVAYRNDTVKQRYHSHRPSYMHDKQQRKIVHNGQGEQKTKDRPRNDRTKIEHLRNPKIEAPRYEQLNTKLAQADKNRVDRGRENRNRADRNTANNNEGENRGQGANLSQQPNNQVKKPSDRVSHQVVGSHQNQIRTRDMDRITTTKQQSHTPQIHNQQEYNNQKNSYQQNQVKQTRERSISERKVTPRSSTAFPKASHNQRQREH